MQYVTFWKWVLSLNIITLIRFLQVVGINSLFLFTVTEDSVVCLYHSSVTQPHAEECWGGSGVWPPQVKLLRGERSRTGFCTAQGFVDLRVGLLGVRYPLHSVRTYQTIVHTACPTLHSRSKGMRFLVAPCACQHLVFSVFFFNFSHSNKQASNCILACF